MKTFYSPHGSVQPPARSWAEFAFVLGGVGVMCTVLWLASTRSRSNPPQELTVARSQLR